MVLLIQEHVRELRAGKDGPFDAAPRADEQRLDVGPQPDECASDGQRRIEMAAGAAAGKDHQHLRGDRKRVRGAAAHHAFAPAADVDQDAGHDERKQEV